MNPAMNTNLVTGASDGLKRIGVDQPRDSWHEETGGKVVSRKDLKDAGNARAPSELSPTKPTNRIFPRSKFERLVVAVKRQGKGAARIIWPAVRL